MTINMPNFAIDEKQSKCGLHILSPYIGKVRHSLAAYLINNYVNKNSLIIDPFCGSGTIALEGWIANQNVLANDLNPYAKIVSLGKLNPYKNLAIAQNKVEIASYAVKHEILNINLAIVPPWVKQFYHKQTLREIIAWFHILQKNRDFFLLANLLGILHHQRPGFLSYPASHGAPYLRNKKYPKSLFPEMYEYRNVFERLISKVERTYRRFPMFDFTKKRIVTQLTASQCLNDVSSSNTIITSPPYMKSLTYARDNRLRLWFLGYEKWHSIEKRVSPCKTAFSKLMTDAIPAWAKYQSKGDYCIIIIGRILFDRENNKYLSDFLVETAEMSGYRLKEILIDPIPDMRRVVKKQSQIKTEEIVILRREN